MRDCACSGFPVCVGDRAHGVLTDNEVTAQEARKTLQLLVCTTSEMNIFPESERKMQQND